MLHEHHSPASWFCCLEVLVISEVFCSHLDESNTTWWSAIIWYVMWLSQSQGFPCQWIMQVRKDWVKWALARKAISGFRFTNVGNYISGPYQTQVDRGAGFHVMYAMHERSAWDAVRRPLPLHTRVLGAQPWKCWKISVTGHVGIAIFDTLNSLPQTEFT